MSNHAHDRAAQEELSAEVFACLHEQDIEQFYAHYQLWVLRRRVPLLEKQVEALREHIDENQQSLESLRPSALAQAVLVRLQSNGVNNIDLLDLMLERGEDWLDHMMQRLDYCEQVEDFIQGDYTQWCIRSLEGAYDWIDSLLGSIKEGASLQEDSDGEIVLTEELLLQKLSQDDEEAMRAVTLSSPAPQTENAETGDRAIIVEEAVLAEPEVAQPPSEIFVGEEQASLASESAGQAESDEDMTPPELLGWKDLEDLEAPAGNPVPWYSVNVTESGASSSNAGAEQAGSINDWITVLQADNEVREYSAAETIEASTLAGQPESGADTTTTTELPATLTEETEAEQINALISKNVPLDSASEREVQVEEKTLVSVGELTQEQSAKTREDEINASTNEPALESAPVEISDAEHAAPALENLDEALLSTANALDTIASTIIQIDETANQSEVQSGESGPMGNEETRSEEVIALVELEPDTQETEHTDLEATSDASALEEEVRETETDTTEDAVSLAKQELEAPQEEIGEEKVSALTEHEAEAPQEEADQEETPALTKQEGKVAQEEAKEDEESLSVEGAVEAIEFPETSDRVEDTSPSNSNEPADASVLENIENTGKQAERISLADTETILEQNQAETHAQAELVVSDISDEFTAANVQETQPEENSADQEVAAANELESAALLNDMLSIEDEQEEQLAWYEYLDLEEPVQEIPQNQTDETAQDEIVTLNAPGASTVHESIALSSPGALQEADSDSRAQTSHEYAKEETRSSEPATMGTPENSLDAESTGEIEGWQTWQMQDADDATLPMALKDIHLAQQATSTSESEEVNSDLEPIREDVNANNVPDIPHAEVSESNQPDAPHEETIGYADTAREDTSEEHQPEAPQEEAISSAGVVWEGTGEESQQNATEEEDRIEELSNAPTIAMTPPKKVGFWRRLFSFGRKKKQK